MFLLHHKRPESTSDVSSCTKYRPRAHFCTPVLIFVRQYDDIGLTASNDVEQPLDQVLMPNRESKREREIEKERRETERQNDKEKERHGNGHVEKEM